MGDRQMNMHDSLEEIGAAICNAFRERLDGIKFKSEFLEYFEDDKGYQCNCNFVVNVSVKSGDFHRIERRTEYAFAAAHAICNAFNLVMIKSEDEDGSWFVYGDPNFWDKDGEETSGCAWVDTVQCCIFQYYK